MEMTLDPQSQRAKSNAMIAYALMVAGLFTGIFWFIGAFWAWFKRNEAVGTIYHSHLQNIVATFWWGLLWVAIGLVLMLVLIGYLVLFAAYIWMIFRLINGISKILSNEAYL
ncbi:MAG: putative membrane protein [Idiomarinaceae bacterium HL-53]|nr:MAG: putative membrane protein [Idiomarinaceae bacterium HL-53]CUS48703.1 Uncharacterized membrane protein [Idiomarinaceae bacterium HL-53]